MTTCEPKCKPRKRGRRRARAKGKKRKVKARCKFGMELYLDTPILGKKDKDKKKGKNDLEKLATMVHDYNIDDSPDNR